MYLYWSTRSIPDKSRWLSFGPALALIQNSKMSKKSGNFATSGFPMLFSLPRYRHPDFLWQVGVIAKRNRKDFCHNTDIHWTPVASILLVGLIFTHFIFWINSYKAIPISQIVHSIWHIHTCMICLLLSFHVYILLICGSAFLQVFLMCSLFAEYWLACSDLPGHSLSDMIWGPITCPPCNEWTGEMRQKTVDRNIWSGPQLRDRNSAANLG